MRHVRRLRALALGGISALALPATVFAQAEWLSPTLGQAMFRGDVRETYYPGERVSVEKRLTGGVRFDLRHVGFEVSGGYAFDRFYFEGDSYRDRNQNRIDVDGGPFVVGRVMVRF